MESRISIITLGVCDFAGAVRFYRDGLGLPTDASESDQIAFFRTSGTRLAIYPLDKLAEDISPQLEARDGGGSFCGITLAHNVKEKHQVAEVLQQAERAGATIVKQAQDVFWGGHSGYFRDPEGYYWEVAWGPNFSFNENGELQL